jgi:hypothetical protein
MAVILTLPDPEILTIDNQKASLVRRRKVGYGLP